MYLVWYLVCYLVWYLASVILGLVHCMIHSLAVEETITVSKIAPPPNRYFRKRKNFWGWIDGVSIDERRRRKQFVKLKLKVDFRLDEHSCEVDITHGHQ